MDTVSNGISIRTPENQSKLNVPIVMGMDMNQTKTKMTTNQIELFQPAGIHTHVVRYETTETKDDQTRPMTMDECVDFIEFLKVMGYNWKWTMIQPIE